MSFHSYRVVFCAPIPTVPRTPGFGSCSIAFKLHGEGIRGSQALSIALQGWAPDESFLYAPSRHVEHVWGKFLSFIGGYLLALLKYPLYPLFNFDNGMNLISKLLTILTSGQLLVVFTFALIFWRYFVFCRFLTNFGAWNDEAHDHAITRRKTKAKAQTKDQRPWRLEARSCTSTLQWSPKDKAHKMRSRYFGAKQSK